MYNKALWSTIERHMELQSWLQMAAGHCTMEQFFASNLRVARHNKALWSISMRKTHGESSLYNENKMATFLKGGSLFLGVLNNFACL
jgi:hypothetical protein